MGLLCIYFVHIFSVSFFREKSLTQEVENLAIIKFLDKSSSRPKLYKIYLMSNKPIIDVYIIDKMEQLKFQCINCQFLIS